MTQIPDLHTVLLKVSKHLTSANIEELNFFFKRAPEPNDSSPKLFTYLIKEGIISDRNVSKLIEALDTISLSGAAKDLIDYERTLETAPSTFSRDDTFVGRVDELDNMQYHLEDIKGGKYGFRAIFITGLPGVGKTYLAEEFQRRESETKVFDRMFISCRGLRTALDVQNCIMENFRISIERSNLLKIFERSLKTWRNTLIILDNLEEVMEHDPTNFEQLIVNLGDIGSRVRGRSHCLLMTSRRRLSAAVEAGLNNVLLPISLENMNERDSFNLLDSYLGQRRLSYEEKKKLMTLCGQHTLSMALVASRLKHSPQVPFDIIADEMKRRPLITLTNMEDLGVLNTRSCVENSLYNTFNSMSPESQDLLVRLSVAADSVKETTARNLYRDLSSSVREAFSESLMRLLELNFVKFRRFSISREGTRRFFIHLLIRSFVAQYCQHADCRNELKATFAEAQEMLRLEYMKELKNLSTTEWQNPSRYNQAIETDRQNFLPQVPQILDTMIDEQASLNELTQMLNISKPLFRAPKERANFILDRKKVCVRKGAPTWVVVFFELWGADEVRLAGDRSEARNSFERARVLLKTKQNNDMTPEQRAWLEADYDHKYGRFLKDETRGDYRRSMIKSVRYLKSAKEKYKNEALFCDVPKYMATVHYDLGNALKINGDHNMCERYHFYEEARKSFDAARIIYEQVNKNIVHLFDVYLSLAACDMELKSLRVSKNCYEDRTSLEPAIQFYNKAQEVAKANPDVIESDDDKMGYMYYSRAICHFRKRDYQAAHGDATRALRLRLKALGCHSRTMDCYTILGNIYSCSAGLFPRHNHRALDSLKKALNVGQRLAWKGFDVRATDLEALLNLFITVCTRLDEDYEEYETIIKAVEKRDLSKLEPPAQDNEIGSEEEMEDCKKMTELAARHNYEYHDSSSDSADDAGDGSAPSSAAARDLSDKLKKLMDKHAERLDYLSHVMHFKDMEILVSILRDGYPNLKPEARIVRFERGQKLYLDLVRLDKSPASVINENRGAKRSKR